jgi:hypothetical protein
VNDAPDQVPPPAGTLRISPYEVAFAAGYEADVFATIAADADLHRTDPLRFERFPLLPSVSDAVRTFGSPDAPPEAVEQYRALLYHGFNYWRYGRPTYLVQSALARFLVEAQPGMEGWELTLPEPSLYLQLPHNLFWGSVSPESTPEPVDGMFVTGAPGRDLSGNPFIRLEVLMVLGLRRERAGFSVIPFDTEAGPGIAAVWAEGGSRESGADFENVLPGGEISGLYSLLTVGEVLKLLGRILWYIDRYPGDVSAEITPAPPPDEARAAIRPSRLPYRFVSLGSGGDATEADPSGDEGAAGGDAGGVGPLP